MKKFLIVGVGRMGWGIAKQLNEVASDKVELFLYDPVAIKRLKNVAVEIGNIIEPEVKIYDVFKKIKPDLVIHSAPFKTQAEYIELAVSNGSDIITLGQDTDFVLGLIEKLKTRDVKSRVVPDCGLAPGFLNIISSALIRNGASEVEIECGGLPIDTSKGGKLHYGLSFSVEGLIQEYMAPAFVKLDGRVVKFDQLEPDSYSQEVGDFEIENVEILKRLKDFMGSEYLREEGGRYFITGLESAYTADGTSVMPWDEKFKSVKKITYRTLRYRGHFEWFVKLKRMGLLGDVGVIESLKKLPSSVPDMVLFRVRSDISTVECIALADELLDVFPDMIMGGGRVFSAMQSLTGWPVVYTALALYKLWDGLVLLDEDGIYGKPLGSIFEKGGVLFPYEFVDGFKLIEALMNKGKYFQIKY